MKKLVLVVAMFMFVCGGSFFAMAQEPVQNAQTSQVTVVTDTIVKDTTTTEPVKEVPDSTATSLAK